jgi:hypothetical protein
MARFGMLYGAGHITIHIGMLSTRRTLWGASMAVMIWRQLGHPVKRTLDRRAVVHVGVDHRRLEALVPQELLNDPDVRAALKQVRGEAVAQGVTACLLVDSGFCGGSLDRSLQPRFAAIPAMTAPDHRRGEDELPAKLLFRPGILVLEPARQRRQPHSFCHVALILGQADMQMGLQGPDQRLGQQGVAVLIALAGSDDDPVVAKINVVHTQLDALHQAHAGSIDQLGHELVGPLHVPHEILGLLHGKHHRHASGSFGPQELADLAQGLLEDLLVRKHQRVERLILRAGRHSALGQMGQKLSDMGSIQLPGRDAYKKRGSRRRRPSQRWRRTPFSRGDLNLVSPTPSCSSVLRFAGL